MYKISYYMSYLKCSNVFLILKHFITVIIWKCQWKRTFITGFLTLFFLKFSFFVFELSLQIASRPGSHNLRCLFRVAFVPRDACDLAQKDLAAFEYLYLQVFQFIFNCFFLLFDLICIDLSCCSL